MHTQYCDLPRILTCFSLSIDVRGVLPLQGMCFIHKGDSLSLSCVLVLSHCYGPTGLLAHQAGDAHSSGPLHLQFLNLKPSFSRHSLATGLCSKAILSARSLGHPILRLHLPPPHVRFLYHLEHNENVLILFKISLPPLVYNLVLVRFFCCCCCGQKT